MECLRQVVGRLTSRKTKVGIVATLGIVALCSCKGAGSVAGTSAVRATSSVSASGGTYVALGDSYAAAPLAGLTGQPTGCLRSHEDYPALVAAALHPRSFTNVSCYGASTYDMTHTQQTGGQENPSQLSALSAADSLVTVQVGGDDIGFSQILATCAGFSLIDHTGAPCEDYYTADGTDRLAQKITSTAPHIAAVLQEIRQRAPHARVLVVGYPDILPVSGGGCWPLVPVARGDVPYLRSVESRLNAMLAAEAAENSASYVDTYHGSVGHDACQPSGRKWVEGLIPTSLAAPMHPNASGEQAMATLILAALHS